MKSQIALERPTVPLEHAAVAPRRGTIRGRRRERQEFCQLSSRSFGPGRPADSSDRVGKMLGRVAGSLWPGAAPVDESLVCPHPGSFRYQPVRCATSKTIRNFRSIFTINLRYMPKETSIEETIR